MPMSSTIYNHRPLPPTAPAQPARGGGPDPTVLVAPGGVSAAAAARDASFRTHEALDVIRGDFESMVAEVQALRLQRDEYELKVNNQIHEIASVRQALADLDDAYKRQRADWENEVGRLRAELSSILSSGPPVVNAPHGVDVDRDRGDRYGGYGRRGPGPGPDGDVEMHDRERDRDRERELRDRERERERDRDRDRDRDMRKGKIPKSEPDHFAPSSKPLSSGRPSLPQPSPGGGNGGGPNGPSSSHNLNNPSNSASSAAALASLSNSVNNSSGAGGGPPVPYPPIGVASSPPPPSQPGAVVTTTTSDNPLADLEPDQVRPDLKKEGSDWWAIFSPRVPRVLDVSLSLTLTHESVVCCVRFSADGKYLATGCNRTAQIYDTKTGARTCVLVDEAATKTGDLYIRSVCFSPDGKYLATGAEDKQIRIWDIAKRKIRHLFEGHTQEIYSLDFSRDGKLIVSGSGDKTARIWDMETGACKTLAISEPESIDAGVTSVAISPDGRWVAAGSLDMVVRIWDVNTCALVERLRGHKDSVYSVAFSPDGRGLVSGSLDKSLKYWDITPMIRAVTAGSQPGSNRVQLRQDGIVASNQGPVPGGKKDGGGEMGSTCTVAFTGHKDYVLSVAVSPDGAWVVSGSKDRGVQFWNPKDAQTQLMLQGHKNSVISIDLSPAGGLLATGSGDWQARVWSYTTLPQSS